LVHQTRRIDLEFCESAEAARTRELALIRQHRPKFNVANTLSPTFSFFALSLTAGALSLRLGMEPRRGEGETLIGAFKNRGLCLRAFLAIGRCLFAGSVEISSVYEFPAFLNARSTCWNLPAASAHDCVLAFLEGEDLDFLRLPGGLVETAADPFVRKIFETDLLTLTEFFDLAQNMSELRRQHDQELLSQEALQVLASRPIRQEQAAPASQTTPIA
jgi:hypothetical protein